MTANTDATYVKNSIVSRITRLKLRISWARAATPATRGTPFKRS